MTGRDVRPVGERALLVGCADLAEVLGLHAALTADPLPGPAGPGPGASPRAPAALSHWPNVGSWPPSSSAATIASGTVTPTTGTPACGPSVPRNLPRASRAPRRHSPGNSRATSPP